MFSPALAECPRSACCSVGLQPERDLTPGRDGSVVQWSTVPTYAGHGAQSALGTQGKEGGARLAAGERVAVFELAPWVGSSTFPCFS